MLKSLAFLLLAMLLAAAGQLLLKHGMSQVGRLEGLSWELFRALSQPAVLAGLFLFGLSSLFWLVLLSREKLSYVYPMVSLNYVFIVILSRLFLREAVPPFRIVALTVICLGVVLYGLSEAMVEKGPPPAP